MSKPSLNPGTPQWVNAIKYLKGTGTIDGIRTKYELSKENEETLKSESI
jgi:hypothetical protein